MQLQRHAANPILTTVRHHDWEDRTCFNAAVVYEEGLFHLVYRAQGTADNVSRLGYAVSTDGVHFSRLDRPVLVPENEYERWGVEDPRITRLGDRYYMLYTAYSAHGTRVSLASSRSLLTWQREGIVLPDEDNKDAALFPAKIGGRYAMLHRRPPDIWLAWSEDLLHWTDHQVIMRPRPGLWDETRVGAGGPPIRTERGWLLIYHGYNRDRVYCLGLALLDLENPAVVISRAEEPVLVPTEPWERAGDVPNVVFTCGSVVVRDEVYVYYGAADMRIALATARLQDLLNAL
ncbi:MAG: glycosidase [Anaerolineae bacterium]|nr:glycosidase [Anaerolineae bacterium]